MGNAFMDDFMGTFKHEGLTFDDISLVTQYADFLPGETSIETSFSRNIRLNIPFVSAAMDTVTESEMAIAMAKLGGIGVIPQRIHPHSDFLLARPDRRGNAQRQGRKTILLLRVPDRRFQRTSRRHHHRPRRQVSL